MTLAEVIARLDAGEGVSERAELADAITTALHGPEPEGALGAGEWWDRETEWRFAMNGAFDAAADLVPDHWAWALHRAVETERPCSASVYVPTGPAAVLCRSGRADTPARALLLALLRAHAAMREIADEAARPAAGSAAEAGGTAGADTRPDVTRAARTDVRGGGAASGQGGCAPGGRTGVQGPGIGGGS